LRYSNPNQSINIDKKYQYLYHLVKNLITASV